MESEGKEQSREFREVERVSLVRKRTIVVVEDEDFVREVTREVLIHAGYRALGARNTAEALALFAKGEEVISLLLTDLKLPGLDGFTLARQLIGTQPGLKAIVVSGYPQAQADAGKAEQSGIEYLPKPFSTDVLLQKVQSVLGSPVEVGAMAKSAAAP
jgi:two-component system, cell cycle sensor histidine kinase and response regulator CckA